MTFKCQVSLDLFFFFFQAEDGIRDLTVTGVQTCALPISVVRAARAVARGALARARRGVVPSAQGLLEALAEDDTRIGARSAGTDRLVEIGRASCRERV